MRNNKYLWRLQNKKKLHQLIECEKQRCVSSLDMTWHWPSIYFRDFSTILSYIFIFNIVLYISKLYHPIDLHIPPLSRTEVKPWYAVGYLFRCPKTYHTLICCIKYDMLRHLWYVASRWRSATYQVPSRHIRFPSDLSWCDMLQGT